MSVDFKNSETHLNLLRAFAGESQARNRYTFAASQAKKQNLHVVEAVFNFTASQETAHAKVFYDFLKEMSGETIHIDGGYPIDISDSIVQLLRYAQHNEFEEADDVYLNFGKIAENEGFSQIAFAFNNIAKIEKVHGERFGQLAELLEQNKLFVTDVSCKWMCLNCGHIIESKEVPEKCPVCNHDKGYFISLKLAPYTCSD